MRHIWLNVNAPGPGSVSREMDDKPVFVFQQSIMATSEGVRSSEALSTNTAPSHAPRNTSPSFH